MSKTELESYREQLLILQRRVRGDVSHLTGEMLGESSGIAGTHKTSDEFAGDSGDLEVSMSLLANEGQVLEDIAAALERLKSGTFGRCEECNGDIAKARLKELPYTPYCVGCARKIQSRS